MFSLNGESIYFARSCVCVKKLWNMQVTIIPIVIGAFGTVTKGLLKRLETWKLADEWRPSKLRHYWERPEYWEESWRLEEICCHSNSSERPSANADVKNYKRVNNNKYLDLARELKKLWNMVVTIILIVIGAFGTVTKGLLKWLEDLEVGGRVDTIETIALLRTARILRWVQESWGDLLSLKLQWKTIS